MKRISICVLSAAALLGGCAEPERSVEWYLEHPEELKAALSECSEQAKLKTELSGNCARAVQAASRDRPSGVRSPDDL